MKVLVYYNTHLNKFSIKERYGRGLVIDHVDFVHLKDVGFKVWKAGRERVLRTGAKNVHAFVVGTLIPDDSPECERAFRPFTYNPYVAAYFYYKDTGEPVAGTAVARLEVVEGRPVCLAG